MIEPYYENELTRLYLGDCREILPILGLTFDSAIVDPPYECTSMQWDHWPDGWLTTVAEVTSSMWCFGSLRMFGTRWSEFTTAKWKLSHDTVWAKDESTARVRDRFLPSHELITHWYQGAWSGIYHEVPIEHWHGPKHSARVPPTEPRIHGARASHNWLDPGTRLMRSVHHVPLSREGARGNKSGHPNEKPIATLTPRIQYAVPDGGIVLDPMAGSCSTGVAAQLIGCRSVLIEAHEPYAECAARRLDQGVLPFGEVLREPVP